MPVAAAASTAPALLQASAELKGSRTSRRLIVVSSDVAEDPSPNCRRSADTPVDVSGIAVVAVNVAKLEADNRNPQGYVSRLDG